ncbi:MAG TPA: AMP-binding protein, partial [Telmatospirillum sp.]|nr:AMP-binding protein [Telmatospirillum sp.]
MTRSIPFIDTISQVDPARPALYCDKEQRWTSYGDLARQVVSAAQLYSGRDRRLAFLVFSNTRRDVAAYLGLLAAGHVVALIDPKLDADLLQRLLERYRPEMVVGERAAQPASFWTSIRGSPTAAWERPDGHEPPLHPDLCLLLTTSGSTGSSKMVRLSAEALGHNTDAIRQTLAIDERTRAVAHLPLHYSYGLSILHSHLLAGASLVLTDKTMLEADFWSLLRTEECTSLPGTPFHYRMMDRLGLDRLDVPTLSVLTQAGGRLEPDLVCAMHKVMAARGGRFYVMYGQTEA